MAQQNTKDTYRKRNLNYLPDSNTTSIVGGANLSKLANNVIAPVAKGSEALMRGVQNIPNQLSAIPDVLAQKGLVGVGSDIANTVLPATQRLGEDIGLGVKGMLYGKDAALNTTPSPSLAAKPVINMERQQPLSTQYDPKYQAWLKSTQAYQDKQAVDAHPELMQQGAIASQSQQPYQMRGGVTGSPVNTLNVEDGQGGFGAMQFKNGRKLDSGQLTGLQATLAREADPAFKARLAEQAAIADARYAAAREGRDRSQTQVIESQALNGGSKNLRNSALGVLANRGAIQKEQLQQQGLAAKTQQEQLNKMAELGISREKLGLDSQVFTPGQKMTDAEGNVTLTDPAVYNKQSGAFKALKQAPTPASAQAIADLKNNPGLRDQFMQAFGYIPEGL